MSKSQPTPSSPPPPYQDATSSSAPTTQHPTTSSHLEVPSKSRNGIPISARRSMEDEARSLPTGWVRQYDSKSHHQFFVDTTASPPRSIWHHPYDDEQYLATLSAAERAEIMNHRHHMEDEDVSSADEHELPPREQGGELTGGKKLGRRIKDKLTHSTHEQRVAERQRRDEEDAKAYRQHQHIRQQMALAAETGVPQLLGKDKDGNDVYIEPPGGPGGYGGGGFNGAGYNDGGYGGGGGQRSYNPYTQGPYSDPNAKFVRPPNPYNRAYPGHGYGYGYGGYGGYGGLGGFGAAPLLGLGGGLLLGGLLF